MAPVPTFVYGNGRNVGEAAGSKGRTPGVSWGFLAFQLSSLGMLRATHHGLGNPLGNVEICIVQGRSYRYDIRTLGPCGPMLAVGPWCLDVLGECRIPVGAVQTPWEDFSFGWSRWL